MKKVIPIHKQLDSLQSLKQQLEVRENILLNKALVSTHPTDIIKASSIIDNVEQRHQSNKKAYMVDPYAFNNSFGYKDKPYSMSYEMLKRISFQVPIVRAIIGTRSDQVASFCEPQSDKYSTGFIIRKKQPFYSKESRQASRDEIMKANKITDFVLNCGMNNSFESDDFDTFIRKIINDSLTYDQLTFEVVNDRRGRPFEFYAVDASTIRIADSYDDDNYKKKDERKQILGYYPNYCQIHDGIVTSDFYPWEMCFGIRNPVTNIYSNGYGVSEIEMLINTITSMLWSDEYNRRFFSQGSAPKGFFKFKSETAVNDGRLAQFKQQWQGMMAGVYNSWKTPVLEGDIDWVSLHTSNQDMEFSKWQEYLIKLTSAIYRIDPAEVNFPLSGGSDTKPMFEGNNEARLKHSKDKGLYPLLKFLQRRINKHLISRIDPEYEFVFVGMDGVDQQTELDNDIKMMSNFMTVDEIRIKRGLSPLGEEKGGNQIANSILYQSQAAKDQKAIMGMMGGGQEEDQFDAEDDGNYEEDPFKKAFDDYIVGLNKEAVLNSY
jgi:hypothetical protein